jgi:hypothetical protein
MFELAGSASALADLVSKAKDSVPEVTVFVSRQPFPFRT